MEKTKGWFEKTRVNRKAKELLRVASPAINRVYLKAMEGNLMAFGSAKETIFEKEEPVSGTNIFGVVVEYAISNEDLSTHSQINFYAWGADQKEYAVYFEQTDFGTPRFEGMDEKNSDELTTLEKRNVLADIIKVVKFAKSQSIIEKSG